MTDPIKHARTQDEHYPTPWQHWRKVFGPRIDEVSTHHGWRDFPFMVKAGELNAVLDALEMRNGAHDALVEALEAEEWAQADKGPPVGDSPASLAASAEAIRRVNAELSIKARTLRRAALDAAKGAKRT